MKKIILVFALLSLSIIGYSARINLDLIQPNGGEITFGDYYFIKWNCNFNDMADIFLYKGNSMVGKVASNVPARNRKFRWKAGFLIRKGAVHGQGFKIKIVAKSKHLTDISNNFFVIKKVQRRALNMPGRMTTFKSSPTNTQVTPGQQNTGKPDLIVSSISTDLYRYNRSHNFISNIWINEPLEIDVNIKNVFAEYGHAKNSFKVKVQLRYGYSGPVHKEKIFTILKLDPGQIVTKRLKFGQVKGTPDVFYIKAIVDFTNVIVESNEKNNTEEISRRIVDPNPN